jgi:DNA end-binding protein Ku
LDRSEIIKGYEHEKDQDLLFSKEELEEIEPESAQTMEILSFVKAEEIDPVYFESSYYALPEEAGARGYQLLLDAMRKTGYSGIAKVTMHGREHIVIIRARDKGFTLHTMFYKDEVRAEDEIEKPNKSEVKEAEFKLAVQLIETLAAPFEPEQFSDTYKEQVERLIEAKAHGKKLTVMPRRKPEAVPDLMKALQISLETGSKQKLLKVANASQKSSKGRKAG